MFSFNKKTNELDKVLKNLVKNEIAVTHHATKSGGAIYRSKIGGKPAAPEGFEWPRFEAENFNEETANRPLSFLCQINLEEICGYDKEELLPKKGLLLFFYEMESMCWGFDPSDEGCSRVYYFEEAKNDGYPVVQLPPEEQKLKGFNWQPDKRPADRNAVTPLPLRPSERLRYAARPRAKFRQTDIYFPGYMDDVYRQIEVRDSLRKVRERERAIAEREAAERARLDSLAVADSLALADSLGIADSLAVSIDSLALADSLSVSDSIALSDSLALPDAPAVADSTSLKELTPEELAAQAKADEERRKAEAKAEKERLKAEKKAALEAKRKAKQEAKEARWAELDKRDAEKAAAKEEKRKEKERKRKRKALEKAAKEAKKDDETLERYKRQYEKQKAKEAAKAARKAASRK